MTEQANQEIRDRIFQNRLKNWEVAAQIPLSDSRFSIWLRQPLNDERKAKVEKAIDSLIEKNKQ